MLRSVVALLLLVIAGPLSAQQRRSLVLHPGDEIRVRGPLPEDSRVVGRVVSVGPDLLGFSFDTQPEIVFTRSYAAIDTLDVRHRSRHLSARSGATWGLYLGTVVGAIVGPFLAPKFSIDTDTAIGVFGAGGGALGIASGAAVGAAIAPVRWYRYVFRE